MMSHLSTSSFQRSLQKYTTRNILKNRFALSTIVSTLIILVISVLLAGVVCYFAINVSSTRQQEENLSLVKQHVWYDSTNLSSEASIMIVNTGGRDVVVARLTIRGQNVNWASVFYFKGNFTFDGDLTYIPNISAGAPTPVSNGLGSFENVVAATTELTLRSGESMIIYIKNPDSISVSDVGLTVAITVFTSQAMYYKETNVQGGLTSSGIISPPSPSPSSSPPTSGIALSNQHAWYDNSLHESQAAILIQNVGSVDEDLLEVSVGGQVEGVGSMYTYVGTFVLGTSLTYISGLTSGSTTALGPTSQLALVYPPTIHVGQSMILYIKAPYAINAGDVGTATSIAITMQSLETGSLQTIILAAGA
jgi:hypothetical protein